MGPREVWEGGSLMSQLTALVSTDLELRKMSKLQFSLIQCLMATAKGLGFISWWRMREGMVIGKIQWVLKAFYSHLSLGVAGAHCTVSRALYW